MERKVTKLEHCRTEVLVNVDKDLWKKAQDKAFDKLAKEVETQGFRKGCVPVQIIKQRHLVNQGQVFNEAINKIVDSVYQEVLTEEKIVPFARPSFDVSKISEDELELKFIIVTRPEVELGKYTGHKVGKSEVSVSEEEVNNAIDELRKQNAVVSIKDGQAEKGDIVVIDFEGSVDGVPFDGGKAENHELELGSHSFIEGFEDQLIGSSAGIEVEVKVKFPENYGPVEIAGKDAIFKVKVNEVKQKVLPPLDEEFVKDVNLPNVETVDQLKENRREQLLKQKEASAKNEYLNKLYEEIRKDSKFDIPEEVLNEEVENRKKDLENRLQQSGIDFEQYLALTRQSKEDVEAQLKAEAEKGLQNYLLLQAIGEKENIILSDEEFDFELAKMADQYNMSIDDIKKALGQNLAQFRHNITMNKIETYLFENNQ